MNNGLKRLAAAVCVWMLMVCGVFTGLTMDVLAEETEEAYVPVESVRIIEKTVNQTVTQKDVTSIAMTKGETRDDLTAEVYPENATNQNVSWSSNDESVVTVNEDNGAVSAVGTGVAVITVRTRDGNHTASCAVTVSYGIALNHDTLNLNIGEESKLIPSYNPADASTAEVTWGSNNASVATVSSEGVVTALDPGVCTVSCTAKDGSGAVAFCTVYVPEASVETIPVESVALDESSLTLKVGEQETLECTILPAEASNLDVFWTSTKPSVCTVDGEGLVSAKAAGTAAVIVSSCDGGYTAMCTVTVKAKNDTTKPVLKRVYYQLNGKSRFYWNYGYSATKYQLQYSTSSSFASGKTKTATSSTKSLNVSGIKKNQKYYVRVRAYRSTKVWSAWSATCSIRRVR